MDEAANTWMGCIICQEQFLQSQRLAMERHVAIFHGNCTFSTLQCDMCQRKYYDVDHFTDHLKTSAGCEFGVIVPSQPLPHLQVHLRSLVGQIMRPVPAVLPASHHREIGETSGGSQRHIPTVEIAIGSIDKKDLENLERELSSPSSTVSLRASGLKKKLQNCASTVVSAMDDPTTLATKSSDGAQNDNAVSPRPNASSRKSSCGDQVEMIEIDHSIDQRSEPGDNCPVASVKRRGRKRSLEISSCDSPRKVQKCGELERNFGGDGGTTKRHFNRPRISEDSDGRSYSLEAELKTYINEQIFNHRPSTVVKCTICTSKLRTIDRSKSCYSPLYLNLRQHAELHLGKPFFACGHCRVRESTMKRLQHHLTQSHDLPMAKGNYRPLSKEQCDELLDLMMKCFFGKKDEPGSLKNRKIETSRNTSTKDKVKVASASFIGDRRLKRSLPQSTVARSQASAQVTASLSRALKTFGKKNGAGCSKQPKKISTARQGQSKADFTSLIGDRGPKKSLPQSTIPSSPQGTSRSIISTSAFLKNFITNTEHLHCHVCDQNITLVDGTAEEDALGHAANHLGKSLYSCQICPRRFRYINGVQDHLTLYHKLKRLDAYDDLRQEREGDLKSMVSICYSKVEVRIERVNMANIERSLKKSINGIEDSDLNFALGREYLEMELSPANQSGMEDDLELVMEVETSVAELSEKEKEVMTKRNDRSSTRGIEGDGLKDSSSQDDDQSKMVNSDPEKLTVQAAEEPESVTQSGARIIDTETTKPDDFSVGTETSTFNAAERQTPKTILPETVTFPDDLSGQTEGRMETCQKDKQDISLESTGASADATATDDLDDLCQYAYKCETCGFVADDEVVMENHISTVHGCNYHE